MNTLTEIQIREEAIKAADSHKIAYNESWSFLKLTPKEGIVEANYSGYISGYEAATKKHIGGDAENDLLLWVVVNRWEYDPTAHEWINNYITDFLGASMKYSELKQLFIKMKTP